MYQELFFLVAAGTGLYYGWIANSYLEFLIQNLQMTAIMGIFCAVVFQIVAVVTKFRNKSCENIPLKEALSMSFIPLVALVVFSTLFGSTLYGVRALVAVLS